MIQSGMMRTLLWLYLRDNFTRSSYTFYVKKKTWSHGHGPDFCVASFNAMESNH